MQQTETVTAFERSIRGAAVLAGLLASAAFAIGDEQPPAVVAAGKDGFKLESEDGNFKVRVAGYVQADARFYANDGSRDGVDSFVLRRVRPVVTGTVARCFDFNITPDFGGGTAALQDAFLDARFSTAVRVKIGKFKGPVGLERLQSATALLFVERGLPTDLVPNRDIGIEVRGELGGGIASYQVGAFDGAPDGQSVDGDSNDGKDVEGRLFLQPFQRTSLPALKGLGLGIAGTSGRQSASLPGYKTIGQLTFFSYSAGVSAEGQRRRVAPQFQYQNGSFRAFGEWVESRQELRRSSIDTLRATNRAWQAAAAVVVTGEAPVAGVVTPRRSFDRAKGTWGALELALRFGRLEIDDAVFRGGYADPARSARRATAWGIGVNWHVTRNVKYAVGFDHTGFLGGGPGGADRRSENAVLVRAQVSF